MGTGKRIEIKYIFSISLIYYFIYSLKKDIELRFIEDKIEKISLVLIVLKAMFHEKKREREKVDEST